MRDFRQFYIGGNWVDPVLPADCNVINPATEEPIAAISLGGAADIDRAVGAAREAFEAYARTSREERMAIIERIIDVYEHHYDEIAHTISDEMGAPLAFARKSQTGLGIGHMATMLEILEDFPLVEDREGSRLAREPVGVCGLITPWNWPVNQVSCKLAPALAAGCTVILKPSEIAPLSAMMLARVMDEAGVPPGVFNLVNGDGPGAGQALAGHQGVDMMSFTGSTRGGVAVAQAAAPGVKRVHQELGGKSPNIILDAEVLEHGVRSGVAECFSNTGQSCDAPTRMLVPRRLHDRAAEIARSVALRYVPGDPRDERTTIGPVVSRAQFDKVQCLIQAGIDEGAMLVAGGTGRPDGLERGFFVRPTVFAGVDNSMRIAREEIFGPVLAIIPFEDEEDAIRIANDSPYGLAAYVSASDTGSARRVAERLRAGMVHINGHGMTLHSPFGGYKQSGNGREWGEFGLEAFVELKVMLGYHR